MRLRLRAVSASRAAALARRFGAELRIARLNAGLTQRQLAARAGVTQQFVSLAERGVIGIGLDVRCALVSATGHELGWRLYPTSTVSLRDSGQLAVAQVIIGVLPAESTARLEVPVAPGDLRAADLLVTTPSELVHVEIERWLVDFQAQVRAAQLKREALARGSGRPVRLVIAIPDSARARAELASIPDVIRSSFPIPSRDVARALRSGGPLGGDGLLFVRTGGRNGRAHSG
ncbi:MAG TPA: helix-turn-helix transcriptional regulator [Candidatus Limnocylindria bacterium]|jgi:transcriptional regulator with XRE-family HTH domain|nr:helix-turn-helix transcriptional regulator [Candidatus Limnocylindria bacterium]